MSFLVAWTSPDGQGYSDVHASSILDAIRVLRFELLPRWARSLQISYVIPMSEQEAV
jgi:hypothetical protein